ncbi:hypothetical protein WJX72_000106 [[Myrmecia] bisecta]|uniref:very-long-chain 3-oxoacyl-CoA synthase n=1 Tax=[Myrmecia] bisecta TaxID=41462 RepID=A0AAW1QNW7_9CHLO
MFAGAAYHSYQETAKRHSAEWMFCLPQGTLMQGPLYFWSYMYYLSKYYEFIDTILLVLKAKPLSVLHVFHHSVVVPMAFLWLEAAQSLQQIALLINTGIHVVMYYYYFLCSIDIRPSWKKLVTNGQIVQFVASFAISTRFWYLHWLTGRCSGLHAMLFNASFNLLLLALFINFHRSSYRASSRARKAKAQ